MKVTFCAHDYPNFVGGPYVWLPRLLPALRERGIESRVLFSIRGNQRKCQAVQQVKQQGFKHSVCQIPPDTEQAITWILEELREDPPDVFIPNLVVPAYYASRWVKKAGIPTIGVMHSDDNFYYGLLDEFVLGPSKYQLSGFVCVSRFLEQIVQIRATTPTIIRAIPCGAPLPQKTTEPPSEQLRIVYLGRLVEKQKQISQLTKAFCRAVKEVSNTEGIIYGSGPDSSSVVEILAEQGENLPVKLGGRIDSDRVQEHLLECHVMVLLSDYEGLPIALMEAMACGVVPVCLRIKSGIPELIEDGVSGLLVDDREDSFVNAIRRLQQETGLWQKLSEGARSKIAAEYSDIIAADLWADFIRELHQSAPSKNSIKIPRYFSLPPVHPALAVEDKRHPTFLNRLRRKTSTIFKHLKKS